MNKQVVQKTLWFPYRCKAKDFTLYYSNQNSLTFGVRIEVCKLMVIDRGSMPFPVEIDSTTDMTVAPVVAGDGRQQRVLR